MTFENLRQETLNRFTTWLAEHPEHNRPDYGISDGAAGWARLEASSHIIQELLDELSDGDLADLLAEEPTLWRAPFDRFESDEKTLSGLVRDAMGHLLREAVGYWEDGHGLAYQPDLEWEAAEEKRRARTFRRVIRATGGWIVKLGRRITRLGY